MFFCGVSPKLAKMRTSDLCFEIDCAACGAYALSDRAKEALDSDHTDLDRQAAAWVMRDRRDHSEVITAKVLGTLIRDGLSREPAPSGKIRALLLELSHRSRAFGQAVDFDPALGWPLVKARGEAECKALIDVE